MKMRNDKIRGIFVPLVTPLDKKKRVDEKGVRRLITSLEPKVEGFIPCLSTGEGRHLSESLWARMMEFALGSAKLPVIAGIEQKKTESVIARARIAMSMGIDTVAVLPPFGENVPQEEILKHYMEITETGVKILVYNKQLMCGTAIDIDTLIRICEIPSVVAVKEGSSDPEFTKKLLESVPDVSVMQAWETLLTKIKTHGSIVPLANLNPELCRAALDAQSREMQEKVDDEVVKFHLEAENPRWYESVKEELVKRGIIATKKSLL